MDAMGDSYCGIYCGACPIHWYGVPGVRDPFLSCFPDLPEDERKCEGCKADKPYAGCGTCRIRSCARGKGISHCIECECFPCGTYRAWHAGRSLVPHLKDVKGNLRAIARDGTKAWLQAQVRRWSCPHCGARYSWYATACPACGAPLGRLAHHIGGVRRIVARFLLRAAYRKAKKKSASR